MGGERVGEEGGGENGKRQGGEGSEVGEKERQGGRERR